MPNSDDDSTRHEHANVALWREGLQYSRNDDEDGADAHSCATTKIVGHRTAKEKAGDDGANGVDCVDEANHVVVGIVEPVLPVRGALHGIVDGCIVAV